MKRKMEEALEYHNSVVRILKTHYREARVMAYLRDGRKIYGSVSVKKGQLYINGESVENEIIDQLFYADRGREKKLRENIY